METKRNFIRFLIFISFFFIFVNVVSGYYITIDGPQVLTGTIGQPLTISGKTSYHVNDLVITLYSMEYIPPSIITSQRATSQNGTLESFSSTFSTEGLQSGPYKFSIISSEDKALSSLTIESVNEKPVILYPSPNTKTTTASIATTTQVTMRSPSIPTPSLTPSLATQVSTIPTQNTVPTTTPIPTQTTNHPIENKSIIDKWDAAIVSLIIAVIVFGLIEYSIIYWKKKERK